jgi:hypothetical protein
LDQAIDGFGATDDTLNVLTAEIIKTGKLRSSKSARLLQHFIAVDVGPSLISSRTKSTACARIFSSAWRPFGTMMSLEYPRVSETRRERNSIILNIVYPGESQDPLP